MKHLALWVCLLGFLTSCASNSAVDESYAIEKEYRATFDETWRAVQHAILNYPLKVNNMDLGQIQTTAIRGYSQFRPPHEENKSRSGGHRYTLSLNVLKVNPRLTKVTILKDRVVYRDFISRPENKQSDGLEESVLLYRIGREIDVEKQISKEMKKK